MYRNTDEALRDAYRFGSLRIEPQNNTAQICRWIESRGVPPARSGLTQHEWHANAAMIQARVERLLTPAELAVIELHYTGGQKQDGMIDITAYIEAQNKGANLLLCDDLLGNIFTGRPRISAIQDKYDLSRATAFRKLHRTKRIVAFLYNTVMLKIEDEFIKAGIVKFCAQAVDM
ncbi:hypothetical protein LST1_06450 [Neisseria elongata]|uniref:hypothetical protein n=1 Tax=Neisseria elongata TaxID=495 RepID=UPI002852DCDC|nr:hypothetical protein LST1_06450 [Neisseria elongata]